MRWSHIGWNLSGLALPLGVAALTVPRLIDALGHERFGLLALAWGMIGYAGAMDLGLGRALTRTVSRLIGEQNEDAIPDVLATAGRITLVTGLMGGVMFAMAAMAGAATWVRAPNTPLSEIQIAMLLLAIALPAQAISATYRGLNEAFLNFRGISLVRAGLGIVNFAGPCSMTIFTKGLPWLVGTLVLSRLIALFAYYQLAHRCLRQNVTPRVHGHYSYAIARTLFSFGGWLTVSSMVSPLLLQADRFVIASTLSAAAVSVYVLPYEVVVQSLILIGALSSVIFPNLSRLMHENHVSWRHYFREWLLKAALLMAITCIATSMLLPRLLPLWVQANLQPESITIGKILCLGVFFNSIGAVIYAALHAQGRSGFTAKLHLIELPIFLSALYLSINQIGLTGAAWAWTGRMLFDTVSLAWAFRRFNA